MAPKQTIIYHGDCADGFTAAWAAKKAWPEAALVAARHGDPPPDVSGQEVVILDFAYPREQLLAMHAGAHRLSLLDHHRSAAAELGDLELCTFDMQRSGAGLAWDHLCGGPRPWIVDYVEDRDLWRFTLPSSREIGAALTLYPFDLEVWDQLAARDPAELAAEGVTVLRHQTRLVESLERLAREEVIAGHRVPVANSALFASELGHRLAAGRPFAAVWYERADGARVYSLRSEPDGLDVSEIARAFGGGGHARAAGFRLPRGTPTDEGR